ncbi:MAG: hypothetical protein Q9181_004443 [Wetmoreana brouardii]
MVGVRRHSPRAATILLRAHDRNVIYREPSSDIDLDLDNGINASKPSGRPSRKRRRVSYHGVSSESDEEVDIDEYYPAQAFTTRSSQPKANAPPSTSVTKSETKCRRTAPTNGVRRPVGAKRSRKKVESNETKTGTEQEQYNNLLLSGRVPPWQTLPYEILLHIFQYASYPLMTETFQPSPSIRSGWLFRVALLCKGFAEPALSALYYTPPLCPPSRVQKLLSSLYNQTENSFMDYRAKVKYLDIEADILTRKYGGQEPVQLGDLLAVTPQVRAVGIHLLSDLPAWHKSTHLLPPAMFKRKAYQRTLFSALTRTNNCIHLSEWTWNAQLALRADPSCDDLHEIHKSNAFQTVRSLTFVNPKSEYDMRWIARAASLLPNLKTIKLKNLDDDPQFLELLPKSLEALEITSYSLLDYMVLTQFLTSHGANLRELVLDHNDSLNMFFLDDLATICPKLKRFKMDLRFYNTHVAYNDSVPKFKVLMGHNQHPAWPPQLRCIELFHLRRWEMGAAWRFFSSLVDSADRLPDLRYIDIKASLDESSWRDRISFRNVWIRRMHKVFRRVSAPPDPRLRSMSTFTKYRKDFRQLGNSTATNDINSHQPSSTARPKGDTKVENSNAFSHVEVKASPHTSNTSGDSDTPLASKRRSTRLKDRPSDALLSAPTYPPSRKRRKPKRKRKADEDSSTEEDSALEDLNNLIVDDSQKIFNDDDDDKDVHIQGMCDVVRVVIDNLRPTEEHLDESYFLDDEISGDEDWNGDDDGAGGGGYAW